MDRLARLRPVLLAAAGLSVFLPGGWMTAAVVVSLGGWVLAGPERREFLLVCPLSVAAITLLLIADVARWRQPTATAAGVAQTLSTLLEDLDSEASEAAAGWSRGMNGRSDRETAFQDLERLAGGERNSRTWLLFDPNGVAMAWAGRGLVHEIDGVAVPRSGRMHVESYTASTFLSVAPLEESRRSWRIAVGESLPIDTPPGLEAQAAQWAVVGPEVTSSAGLRVAEAEGVRIALRPTAESPTYAASREREWAGLLLAAVLALVACERSFSAKRLDPGALALAISSGATALFSLSVALWILVPYAAGVVMALGVHFGNASRRPGWKGDLFAGLCLTALLLTGSWALQLSSEAIDLGRSLGGGAESAALRIGLFVLALGFLRTFRMSPDLGPDSFPVGRLAHAGLLSLLVSASVHGWTVAGLGFLMVGAILAVAWARRGGWRDGAVGVVAGCLLAALTGAVAWEISFHRALEGRLRLLVEEDLAPPTPAELELVASESAEFFASQPLDALTMGDPDALLAEDLAFALWRRSPLVRAGRLSSVTVGALEDPVSSFAYGLPSPVEAVVGSAAEAWPELSLPGWENAFVEGSGELTLGGGPWAKVMYRLLLRPGFREGGSLLPRLAEGLLRRRSEPWPKSSEVVEGIYLGLYTGGGDVIIPPWVEAPALQSADVPTYLETPAGRARTFVASDGSTIRLAFLPSPSVLTGLERIATHSAAPLLGLLLFAILWFVLTLADEGRIRTLRGGWRTFSKRLVLLYTVLLVIPIVLINVLVLRVFSERLEREQRRAGQSALESAQSILSDYVFSLEPGFGIDTAVSDDVLLWLSGVVDHDVNLYWGSLLSASSKRELFSSGLLPQRIPGDIFSRITLGGASLASRKTLAGGATYTEFYTPLEPPGGHGTEDAGLFLSTPLLAQEVAAAEEMRVVRRRMFLAGTVVALLLALLGRRVARSLTRPLHQIIEGTQAIAAGAPSVSIDATDSEFATLAEAIDEMAGRIAAARADLMREKEVVDRMIDNITSGVISVDREGRAQLLNRTATSLLGISPGEVLAEAVARDESLLPVLDFLEHVSEGGGQQTVRLAAGGEEKEWTLLWVPLEGSGDPKALFVLEDVTEVLRGQRLQAWAEMARVIAHEVKNPLTPIRLSTEHLREVRRTRRGDLDEALEQCTANILRQVDELQQIASDFADYSRIPAIDPQRGDLGELVESVVEGYRTGGPALAVEKVDGPWVGEYDAKLLSRAVRNLLENAVRATRQGGEVQVTVRGREEEIEIRVVDSGPGVPQAHLSRIFEPYFSTEDSGTGLGLPITRRIVEEHGGTIGASNVQPHGLEVVMTLPRAPRDESSVAG